MGKDLKIDIHIIRSNDINIESRVDWDVHWKLSQVPLNNGFRVFRVVAANGPPHAKRNAYCTQRACIAIHYL